MSIVIRITDNERLEFMRLLIDSYRADGANLDEFEQSFTASFQQSSRPTLWFTEKRRICTDKMWMKFGGVINHPFPTDQVVPVRPKPEDAKSGCCQYLVRGDDGVQRPCNETAVLRRGNGFRYCDQHAEQVREQLKKMRKMIHLESI